MKFREDKWLEQKASEWVKEKIISPAQAQALLEHTNKSQGVSALNASMLLTALGGLCVALGVVLLISYNWDKIPAFVKMGVFILLLAGTAEGVHRLPPTSKVVRTALLILWFMLPLAGIGLWAQIYQLSGDPLKPVLIWRALGLPLVFLTSNPPLVFLHTVGMACAVFTGAFTTGTWFT